MDDDNPQDPNIAQPGGMSITGDNIHIGGDVVGGNKTIGYTAEQVSAILAQIGTTFQPKPFDGRCPYVGLDVFEEEDAARFFGREGLVAELVARVKAARFIVIAGPSGSGKSSLVRAGLIHTLKQGELPGSDRWLYATMKPGRDPIEQLAWAMSRMSKSPEAGDYIRRNGMSDMDALHKLAEATLSDRSDQRAMLVADQFEEIFTQVSKEDERTAFLNLLTHAVTLKSGRVSVLVVMRSDFVSNCAAYPQLNALLNRQFFQVGAMQPEELVRAIALPARHVGLKVDPDLIAQMINDMQDEPGALPLMQFALKDLFEAQQAAGGVIALTLPDYLARGGIRKSLERHADAAFAKLSQTEQQLARAIFTSLVQVGRGTQDTRRTAMFKELAPAGAPDAEVEAVIRKLADARLVTTDEPTVSARTATLAHEKLIDAWPWLRKLVNENRDVIALQSQIGEDAQEWEQHQRDSSYLYTGARLAQAREELGAKKIVLGELAQAYVDAGVEAEEAEQRKERARQQKELEDAQALAEAQRQRAEEQARAATRLRVRNRIITGAGIAATVAAVIAIWFGVQFARQNRIALSRQLAAQAVSHLDDRIDLALLLSLQSKHIADLVESKGSLLTSLQRASRITTFLYSHTAGMRSMAFSPDGKMLAAGSIDGTILLWDMTESSPTRQVLQGHTGNVLSVAFSPDGKILASGSYDKSIILWDVATGQRIGQPLMGHDEEVRSLAFSPDGKLLASGSYDATIILWDVATGRPIGQPLKGPGESVYSVTFSPDGQTLASGHNNTNIIALWDVATRKPEQLHTNQNKVFSLAFSPDGRILASGGNDGKINLWNTANLQSRGHPLIGHWDDVYSVAFSPDGTQLVSGGRDGNLILWDVATASLLEQRATGQNQIFSVAFSPAEKILASAHDNAIILWNEGTDPSFSRRMNANSPGVVGLAYRSEGRTLMSASRDGTIAWWDVASGQFIGQFMAEHKAAMTSIAFSPNEQILASGHKDGAILLWDAITRQQVGELLSGHQGNVTSIAFSPDGKLLASGGSDRNVLLWDVTTGQALGPPLTGHVGAVTSVTFSPDGKTLASSSCGQIAVGSVCRSGEIRLWDVASREPLGQPMNGHISLIQSVAFSPDGKMLASAGRDRTIILWQTATHQQLGQPLLGHTDMVYSVSFSPDGKTLASAGLDRNVFLWDIATGQAIGRPLTGHTDRVWIVSFSPDGQTLATGSDDGTAMLWDTDPKSWATRACNTVARNLTQAEWEQYLPGQPYRKTCDQWPEGE